MPVSESDRIIRRHNRPVVITDFHQPTRLVQTLTKEAEQRGWRIVDTSITNYIPADPPPIGAIVKCWPSHPLFEELEEMGCPTVSLQGTHDSQIGYAPIVLTDQYQQGQAAATHFAERGFLDVAYVGHDPWSGSAQRFFGFRDKAEELGIDVHLHRYGRIPGTGRKARADKSAIRIAETVDWILNVPKPVGFFAYNSEMATRFCIACQLAGLVIPDDVAIISASDRLSLCELSTVPISSIDQNFEEMGRTAITLLEQLISGAAPPTKPILISANRIIDRHSTDVLAVKDSRVSLAMRYIWDHVNLPLGIEDVAREVGVPRSTLDRLFKQHLGRSPNAELRRKRISNSSLMEIIQCLQRKNDHYYFGPSG